MNQEKAKFIQRKHRHKKIRARISGTSERPRLSVHRSLKGMYAQIIDDISGKTLVSAHTKEINAGSLKNLLKEYAGDRKGKTKVSFLLGKHIAELAKEKKITSVVFDRGGNRYHGRVKALADGAREGGLKF